MAVLLLATADAGAQVLDLDAPAKEQGPPALGLETYASQRLRSLLDETDTLALGLDGADPVQAEVLTTRIRYRQLTAVLYDLGDRHGALGSVAVLAAVRLDRGRGDVDATLATLNTTVNDAARSALQRFNAVTASLPEQLEPDSLAGLDTSMGEVFGPLAEAVEHLTGQRTVSHWVTREVVEAQRGEAVPNLDATLVTLAGRVDATALPPDAKQSLRTVLEFLRRGAAFEALRPTCAEAALLLVDALDAADAVAAAGWLADDERDVCDTAIAEALALFADGATRDAGAIRLRHIAVARDIVLRITQLAQPGRGEDTTPVRSAFTALVVAESMDPDHVARFLAILDALIAYRELAKPPATREVQVAWRKLNDTYRRAEQALLQRIPELISTPGAFADPALSTLVATHAQALADLQLVASLPRWTTAVRDTASGAAGPFTGRARKLAAWLGDAGRRDEALADLTALAERMDSYFPLPFEAELRASDPAAIVATGGLMDELLEAVDAARVAWVQEWAAGTPGDDADRMTRVHTLLRTMARTARLVQLGEAAAALNGWAAWELDAMTVSRLSADLRNRLKLATTAAVGGDDDGLQQQLDQLRTPPAILYDRLARTLLVPLRNLPDGTVGILGQCVHPAPANAWLPSQRQALAEVCRYFMELEYARATGRQELADALGLYVNDVATRLVADPEISP